MKLNRKKYLTLIVFVVGIIFLILVNSNYRKNKNTDNDNKDYLNNDVSNAERVVSDNNLVEDNKSECKRDIESLKIKNAQDIYNKTLAINMNDVSNLNKDLGLKQWTLMMKYYACALNSEESSDAYSGVSAYINSLSGIPESNRKMYELWFKWAFENKYNGKYVETLQNVALEDSEKICPDKLTEMCMYEIGEMVENKEKAKTYCENFCNKISNYSNNENILFDDIKDESYLDNEVSYFSMAALAYRFGGIDLANDVCNKVNDDGKINCLILINSFDYIKNIDCSDVKKNLADLYCGK